MTLEKKQWPQKTVVATVKSLSQDENGWVLGLDIPSFKSQYPTQIYRLTDEQIQGLKIGSQYNLILTQESLKTGKDGQAKSGKYPTDFFYGYVGITAPLTTETARSQQPRDSFQEAADARQVSIERQSTLTNAVVLCIARGTLTDEAIKQCHDFLYGLLHGTPAVDKLTEAFGPPTTEENPAPGAKASKAAPKQASSGAPVNPLKAEVIALAAKLGVKEAGVPTWVRAHVQPLKDVDPSEWTRVQVAQIRDAMKAEVESVYLAEQEQAAKEVRG